MEQKRSGTAEWRRGQLVLQMHIQINRWPRSEGGDVSGIGWKGKDSLVVILKPKIIKELRGWMMMWLEIPSFVELCMVTAFDQSESKLI